MKKILVSFFIVLLCLTFVVSLTACFNTTKEFTEEDFDYIPVSTVEDLLDMSAFKAYRLTADIDMKGMTWDPIMVWAFNGDGHTIKNCTVTTNFDHPYASYSYAGFFSMVGYLSDVVFENINVKGVISNKEYEGIGIVAGSNTWYSYTSDNSEECKEFEEMTEGYLLPDQYTKNVTVRNSSINITSNHTSVDAVTYVGGLVGVAENVENCTVENCIIDYRKKGFNELFIGGAFGKSENIVSCNAENVDINPEINSSTPVSLGGFTGKCSEDISNSYSSGCKIELSATGGTCNMGGFVGATEINEAAMINCMSYGNTLSVVASGENYSGNIGGFAGFSYNEINNCLSKGNKINIDSTGACQGTFLCCGFVGKICYKGTTTGSVVNSMAVDNIISNNDASGSYTSGFYASTEGSISFCAVKNNTLYGSVTDVFGAKSTRVQTCVADSEFFGNANDLQVVTESEWNEDTIFDILRLSGSFWSISADGNVILKQFELK